MRLSKKLLTLCKPYFEEDILKLCLSLSDDKDFQKDVQDSSHRERVEQLESNGFEIPNEFKTWKY